MDYNNNIIYKIICKNENIKFIYVGSTVDLDRRKREHKYRCNKGYNYLLYKTIRENGGWENWDTIKIEDFPCNNKKEAFERERQIWKKLNGDLNSKNPQPTKEEKLESYKIKNKKMKEKGWLKEYRKTDKFKEYTKEYNCRRELCSCGKNISVKNKKNHLSTLIHKNIT